MWRRPVPAEQAALDRPWRLWASTAVGVFALVSVALAFLVVPWNEDPGSSAFAVICRAIGIPGYNGDGSAASGAAPVSGTALTGNILSSIRAADPARGANVAAEICAACHGETGISVDPATPNLAGQPVAALVKQLHDYRSGARQSDIMAPMAQGLEDQQVADVAAFFSSQPRTAGEGASRGVGPEIVELVEIGDPARAIPPCSACHEAGASGPVDTPDLIRQRPDYLHQQLVAFAEGTRRNDTFGRMRNIAELLTAHELRRLADYYGGQPVD
jgi:cytochrome c553